MQYKLGQHVLVKGRGGRIVQVHNLFDEYLYTIQPDALGSMVFTISEDEIVLC